MAEKENRAALIKIQIEFTLTLALQRNRPQRERAEMCDHEFTRNLIIFKIDSVNNN